MATYKPKSKWKSIVAVVVIIATLIVACAGLAVFTKKDTKNIKANAFDIGAINSKTGEYLKSDTVLSTLEPFECKGLEIIPNFDSTVLYQIFWYNEDQLYIGCTEKTGSFFEKFIKEVPSLAVYARISIYPCDESGREIKEAIKVLEKRSLAKSLEITVSKEQKYKPVDYYELAMSNAKQSPEESLSKGSYYLEGYHYMGFDENNVPHESYSSEYVKKYNEGRFAVIKTDCNVVQEYIFKYNYVEGEYVQHIFFFDSTGNLTSADDIVRLSPVEDGEYRVSIPSNATYMVVNVGNTLSDFGIFEYIPRNSITANLY